MEQTPLMSAIDLILSRLADAGIPAPAVPKSQKPETVAFVDVNACVACGLCVQHCPAQCIEVLPAGSVPDRDPQPVQMRYPECVGCHVCVEVCAHIVGAHAVRSYDANLIEQVLGTEITSAPEPVGLTPEPGDEYWAEAGGFHHMGEGSQIDDRLSEDDRATLASERPAGSGAG